MSDVEVGDRAEEDCFGDNAYRSSYVYRPVSQQRKGRPNKKRKLNDGATQYSSWPQLSNGRETLRLADWRKETFIHAWQSQEARIKATVKRVNPRPLDDLNAFADTGSLTPSTGRLRTALLLSGLDGTSSDLILNTLALSSSIITISIHARQCQSLQVALKNIIKLVVQSHADADAYKKLLDTHKKLIPLNFDLELLQLYVREHAISQIIVSIPDVESLDSHVTNELISMLYLWRERIRFVLLFNITSTVELFQTRLSKDTMRSIDAKVFNFLPSIDVFSNIVRILQTETPDNTPFLDPSAVAQLCSMTDSQGMSFQAFQSAVKYIYMSHFFANQLSILLDPSLELEEDETRVIAEVIRHTDSFASHCESLLSSRSKQNASHVKDLLRLDKALISKAQQSVSEDRQRYSKTCSIIYAVVDLYSMLIQAEQKGKSRFELEVELYQSIHNLVDTNVLEDIEVALQTLSSSRLSVIFARADEDILLTLNLRSEVDKMKSSTMNGEDHNLLNGSSTTETAAPPSPQPQKRKRASQARSKSTTSTPAKNNDASAYTTSILSALRTTLTEASLDPSTLFLNEAWLLDTTRIRFRPAFMPTPRATLERALLKPQDYLNFDFTEHLVKQSRAENRNDEEYERTLTADTGAIDGPAASVLFRLLQEAPQIINVRDLYDAFCSRYNQNKTSSRAKHKSRPTRINGSSTHRVSTNGRSTPETAGDDDEDDNEDEKDAGKTTMVQFYTALSALRMLGFVKSSAGQAVQRRAGASGRDRGSSSRQGGGEVDFVAKTSWAGL